MSDISRRGADRASRLARAAALGGTSGKVCPADRATLLLEAIIEPGDRVTIEGDNQKQADFLASALAKVDPARVHHLHMVQSVLALPDHLAVFERGIANRLDFAYAGPQRRRLAELVASKALRIGAIITYLDLYARALVDLTPQVALVVADKADRAGNLYTGPNTEDTPTITEAAAFRGGIVVAQVNEIVDHLPRVDVPGDRFDFVVPSPNLSTVTLLKEIRRGGLPPSRLRRACDYMVSRLGEDVSLQDVAASVELSTGHFSTAFKQSSGATPHAWMRRQRIDRAKTLLHDANLNLTQIAIILGYANQSSLGVAFKRETGVTPTQWRVREIG